MFLLELVVVVYLDDNKLSLTELNLIMYHYICESILASPNAFNSKFSCVNQMTLYGSNGSSSVTCSSTPQ